MVSARPLFILGHGIRLAGLADRFPAWLEERGVPFVTTWLGADLMPSDHPLNHKTLGVFGNREANEAVWKADSLIGIGTNLNHSQTGGTLPKVPKTLQSPQGALESGGYREPWSTSKPRQWPQNTSYAMNQAMTSLLPEGSVMVVDGGGSALYTGFQSSEIKKGSRLICSAAISAMGSGLPEAVGAAFARPGAVVTCLVGDGSLMLNLQELQTIKTHKLRIKIFVLCNKGYLAIKATQKTYQQGRYFGVEPPQVETPTLERIADCFDIPLWHPSNTQEMLRTEGPGLCGWECDPDQPMLHQAFKNGKPLPLSEMEWS